MTEYTSTVVLDGLKFPEGPRWHDGRLWFSDMHAHRVMTLSPNGQTSVIVEVPNQPSGLGFLPDGRLLVVSMVDRKLMVLDPGAGLREVADLGTLATGHTNDMVVDARGRAYIGNFGFDLAAGVDHFRTANLVLVQPNGVTTVAADDLGFPNGAVITPDGRTLIVGETFARKLTAFDIAESGALSNRRTWADTKPANPDGICLDAEGAIWVASPTTREFIRVKEGGEVTDRVTCADGRSAYACTLGDDDRRTLYLCTSSGDETDRVAGRSQGWIETVRVEVPGAGWP
jgi:sugar lactone lactonase YvrE